MHRTTLRRIGRDVCLLQRPPNLIAWTRLIGLVSLGIGALMSDTAENFLMKLAVLLGTSAVGVFLLGHWEECEADRRTKMIYLRKFNWFNKLRGDKTPRGGQQSEIPTEDVADVQVQGPSGQASNLPVLVALLQSGDVVPLLEPSIEETPLELHDFADLLKGFLKLNRVETVTNSGDDSTSEEDFQEASQHVGPSNPGSINQERESDLLTTRETIKLLSDDN